MPTTLLAQDPAPPPVKKQKDIFKDADLLVWAGVLIGSLLLAAIVVFIIDRWRKRTATEVGRVSTTLQLTDSSGEGVARACHRKISTHDAGCRVGLFVRRRLFTLSWGRGPG